MIHKIGAIPFAMRDDRIAILFVTSQRRGRWILPKGNLRSKETHKQGCKREAFEEAGVKGKVLKHFPLTVVIGKSEDERMDRVAVTYYPLLVTSQADDWPEADKRQRHWALLEDAIRVTDREDFHVLIKQFDAIAPWVLETSKHKISKLTAQPTPEQ
ncbi:MAG: NUDIX hydrolase [Alphaproteobacteria bacterium]|nr:NUDIX hydrolase [Alphaproteobacteria bacterium]